MKKLTEQELHMKEFINDDVHLFKLTLLCPDGHLINQMAHALIERNAELLSLREQLAELKSLAINCMLPEPSMSDLYWGSIGFSYGPPLKEAKPDDVNNKVDITCYSCRRFITFQQHAEADGFCPYCNVEIELESKGD